ncbi:MAG: cell division protein FtsL [Oscillospiraceae bacterium]|jgi:cell division protein FtsL|nr:cell division protein FtsL [Oscillospiraceae bacterium]
MTSKANALGYNNSTTVHVIDAPADAKTICVRKPVTTRPQVNEKKRQKQKSNIKVFNEVKNAPGISFFAIVGTLVVSVLLILVVLAQVSYHESATEAVRLTGQLRELTEIHRALELAFESSINIKEVERIARDELGMSRPDATQIITINTIARDSALVLDTGEERTVQGFADFIKSLTSYFRSG